MAASSRSSSSSSSSSRRCPQCNSRVQRVEREPGDKRLANADSWRRYRCRNDACGWSGLMEAHRRHRNHLDQMEGIPLGVRVGVAALALLMVAGLSWGLFNMLSILIEN